MKITRLLFIFLLLSIQSSAGITDTIRHSLSQKPKLFVSLASHNTFIDQQYASLFGLRSGLNFNNKIRFGLGYFELTNNTVVSKVHFSENDLEYETAAELHMYYFSLSAEYFAFNKYPWLLTVTPFNTGIGSAKYEYVRRPEQKKVYGDPETLIFYQPEASVTFNIIRWLGVGTTAGYRFTILRSKQQTQHLDGVAFSIDAKVFVDELFKEIMSR